MNRILAIDEGEWRSGVRHCYDSPRPAETAPALP